MGLQRGAHLEIDGTAYGEGEENPNKVPANVCHLGEGHIYNSKVDLEKFHLGSKCILSDSPSLMMAIAPYCEIGQAPNCHLSQKLITES